MDHGKTELVKALTGRNTDRLDEERDRGISIVLGFAPLDLGEGITAGIVDVPGHERFVKNMVSGAVGVDLALIVIAVDEGVMPQTVEHFEVLRLLGVETGVIAITKMDISDPDIAEIVESEVLDLLKDTPLENSPFVRTSAITGEGIDELKKALREQAEKIRRKSAGEFFRMPVDRVFTRAGIGTIVTGTTWQGEVHKGDELVVEPGGGKVRVRDIHNFEAVLGKAEAGMRTALALHGVKTSEVETGSQLFSPGIVQPSSMLDAVLEISSIKGSRIRNRQRVRFHHAAAEILARVILLDREELLAGEKGFVQLRMERPAVAVGGDRFVLRTYSPMRILAGGKILDPMARKAKRFEKELVATLKALSLGSVGDTVMALVNRAGEAGVSKKILRIFGLSSDDIEKEKEILEKDGRVITVQGQLISSAALEKAEARLYDVLKRFAGENPLVWGVDREQARMESGLEEAVVFDYLLKKGGEDGKLFFKGGRVRMGSAHMKMSEKDMTRLDAIEKKINEAGLRFVGSNDLLAEAGDRKMLVKYLHILQENGKVIKLGQDGFAGSAVIDEMIGRLREMLSGGNSLSIGDFKESFGLSRKYAVPLLEFLDDSGLTVRRGDSRVAGPEFGKSVQ